MHSRMLKTGLLLCFSAAVCRYFIAPWGQRLPSDYANEVSYAANSRFRPTPESEWQLYSLTAHRVEQTLASTRQVNLINGNLRWTSADGEVTYETTGLYGVDRRTRQNVTGYGNLERHGQYLFPCRLQSSRVEYWDCFYGGPAVAEFERTDQIEGLTVNVFRFRVGGYDDTAGFASLPQVPERFVVQTTGRGTLWIEPVSGIVVDFLDQGESTFLDASTHAEVAQFYTWTDRFVPESRARELARARSRRLTLLALGDWAPAAMLLVGVGSTTAGLWRGRTSR